jgi:hypothetical protein
VARISTGEDRRRRGFGGSDSAALSPGEIQPGDRAYVVGWNKGDYVLAEKIVIDRR